MGQVYEGDLAMSVGPLVFIIAVFTGAACRRGGRAWIVNPDPNPPMGIHGFDPVEVALADQNRLDAENLRILMFTPEAAHGLG